MSETLIPEEKIATTCPLLIALELSFEIIPGQKTVRKFYEHPSSLICFTSNELTAFFEQRQLYSDYEFFSDMYQIFESFHHATELKVFLPPKYYNSTVPKFIYYDIAHMDKVLIQRFLVELKSRTEGVLLDAYQLERVKHWVAYDLKKGWD